METRFSDLLLDFIDVHRQFNSVTHCASTKAVKTRNLDEVSDLSNGRLQNKNDHHQHSALRKQIVRDPTPPLPRVFIYFRTVKKSTPPPKGMRKMSLPLQRNAKKVFTPHPKKTDCDKRLPPPRRILI